MKLGLIVVAAVLASAFAASFLLQDPGYVVVQFHGYLVEMSVPAMLALLVLLIAGLWLLVKLLRVPRRLGEAAGRYRSGRAGQKLTRGMIEMRPEKRVNNSPNLSSDRYILSKSSSRNEYSNG
jgi:HemY protein